MCLAFDLQHMLCANVDTFLNINITSFTALKKGRFWITPDPYHNDDNIQIGREVKISCQVEATPPEELTFSWLKNGRALRSSERMVITQTDPDISPGTTNLDIIDLKFTDFGTYTCVAALKGGGIPEISIDVNISSTTESQLLCYTSRWQRMQGQEAFHQETEKRSQHGVTRGQEEMRMYTHAEAGS
ncbi:hypothetical protein AMECASPLE_026630 [Ameca splendens]|uniref:Ig-like domain-containing protein n=1 Tax=Ameca splendens TaxID=208324 RepID=A0ABV0XI04_9TELE